MRIALLFTIPLFAGCASMSLPDIGGLGEDFRDTRTDITDTPSVSNAPVVPGDLRSDADWDRAARSVMSEREGFANLEPAEPLPDLDDKIARLRAEVDAYKLDDPAPGD